MANPNTSEKSNALDREENITRGNLSAKRVVMYNYDAATDTLQPVSGDGTTTLADFSVNDMTDEYFGFTKPDGTWLVKKLTDTSVTYATVSNNGTVTSYTDAWTDKSILNYGRFDEAF